MDDNGNDFEAGTISNVSRNSNKKMRKRKHLDALHKFRSTQNQSNDILQSSEDELFLPHQKSSITKIRSSSYHRCWYYSKRILSFTFICLIIITCIALIYANIELKNEVENLSLQITEIEKKFFNVNLNNISSIIKQIEIRLNLFEQLNIPVKDKSEQVSDITDQLNNEFQSMKIYFEQLNKFVHNSSDKTSVILTEFQSNLDNLRNQINECKCSKESIHLKPSIVDSDQLQQSIVTKPNVAINDNKQSKNDTIDVEHIVNRPLMTG
jgi:hypothetical protein